MKRYKIAITMDFLDEERLGGLFTNGLRQNAVLLYRMFKASANCEQAWILNQGAPDFQFPDGVMGIPSNAVVRFDDIKDDLDYLLVMGTRTGAEQTQYLRQRGCKIVFYKGGNAGVLSMEGVAESVRPSYCERYFDADWYDAVWMTSQHMHTYAKWAEVVYRVPVTEIPQIWDHKFIEMQDEQVKDKFGYRKGRKKWRVGICDPSITVMKTMHMPMLVCEAAYRKAPKLFEKIYVTNALGHMQNTHFSNFAGAMSAAKAGVMTVEQRFMVYDFMAHHAEALVTHHWENGLNYLYYEILFGDYPLIHNSEFLKDYGYYYKDFDAEDGGRVLVDALRNHDKQLEHYHERNQPLFRKLDPVSAENIALHEGLLKQVKVRK